MGKLWLLEIFWCDRLVISFILVRELDKVKIICFLFWLMVVLCLIVKDGELMLFLLSRIRYLGWGLCGKCGILCFIFFVYWWIGKFVWLVMFVEFFIELVSVDLVVVGWLVLCRWRLIWEVRFCFGWIYLFSYVVFVNNMLYLWICSLICENLVCGCCFVFLIWCYLLCLCVGKICMVFKVVRFLSL